MIEKEKIEKLTTDFLEGTSFFLVNLNVDAQNNIQVFVDGDQGISIDQCIKISRHLESSFDRDLEDFSLNVSSPGLTKPLQIPRQFNKYIGKELKFFMQDENPFKGKLLSIDDTILHVESHIGSKKNKEIKVIEIDIHSAIKILPLITFK